jgi:hypothetical protein
MPVAKFHNRANVPPRGGWRYEVQGNSFEKYTEDDLISEIRAWRQNNGTFTSDAAIEAEIWQYFCAREPGRCGTGSNAAAIGNVVPRELSPVWYGPIIWRYLNFEAVRFEKSAFANICNRVLVLMDCPECVSEWSDILKAEPPSLLNTAYEACRWIWRQHNRVSAKKGKSEYTYERGVAEYGFPIA